MANDPGLQIDLIGQVLSALLTELGKEFDAVSKGAGAAAPAAKAAAAGTVDFGRHLGDLSGGLQNTALVAGFAFSQLSQLTGAIQSQIGTYVALYSPAAIQSFDRAVKDLNASIGEAMLPVLERFRVIVRALGDTVASSSPAVHAMIAGVAAGGVAIVVFTAAVAALVAVVSIASGGTTIALTAAIGGLVAGLATAATTAAAFGTGFDKFKDVIYSAANVLEKSLEVLGEGFTQLMAAMGPALGALQGAGESFGAVLPSLIRQGIAQVLPIISTLAELFAGLMPTFTAIAGAVLSVGSAIMSIQSAVLAPIMAVITALIPVVKLLLMPLVQAAALISALAQVIGFVSTVTIALTTGPLRLLAAVFGSIFDMVGEMLSPIGDAFSELYSAFGELFAVFKEIGSAIGPLTTAIGSQLGEVLRSGGALFARFAEGLRNVIYYVVDAIRDLTAFFIRLARGLRELFGLPEIRGGVKRDSSVGKATYDTGTSSVEDVIRKAQEAAFSQGRGEDAADRTADNTERMAGGIERVADSVTNLASEIRGYAANVLEVVGRVAALINPLAGAVSTASMLTNIINGSPAPSPDVRDSLDRTVNVK